MSKWYEAISEEPSNIIYSRIRLARNWNEYVFPSRLDEAGSRELVDGLRDGLKDIGEKTGTPLFYRPLETMAQAEKKALRERRILNRCAVEKTCAQGLYLSEDESESILLGADDHIRLQFLSSGLCLEKLWQKADEIDDAINEHFPYAYDEKYGYLTSFPTNMGTGLRASVVLHLPSLSMGKKFHGLTSEMSRFGATVRSVYGDENENYGALYEVSNQKTLGISEKEILDLVTRVALQLSAQEAQVRKMAMEKHSLECADEAYKSYGVLKYARRLSYKDAMTFLSRLMSGLDDGILETREPCAVYRLMLGIQPASLQKLSDRPLGKNELDMARAAYLRRELPELR